MRVKNIRLKDYKRFTDLTIADVPEAAKLVVLVGPNGSGKSSVFDSFILKAKAEVANYQLNGDTEQYYEKVAQARHLGDIAQRVTIEFHGSEFTDFKAAFQVRSAYRNEADFRIEHLQASRQGNRGPKTCSNNRYGRCGFRKLCTRSMERYSGFVPSRPC